MVQTTSLYKQDLHFGFAPAIYALQRLPWPFTVQWFATHGLLHLKDGNTLRIAWAQPESHPDGGRYATILLTIVNLSHGTVFESSFDLGEYVAALPGAEEPIEAYMLLRRSKAHFAFSDDPDTAEIRKSSKTTLDLAQRFQPLADAITAWLMTLYGGPFLAGTGEQAALARVATDDAPIAIVDDAESELQRTFLGSK
jgi:hypothetical protein